MARRAGFRQDRGNSPRRLTSWDEGVAGGAPTSDTSSITKFIGSALTFNLDGLTLIRTRGEFMANLGSGSAQNVGYHGAVGIGIATAAAVAVGIASVPTPITEQGWDGWIWWAPIYIFTARADEADGPSGTTRLEIDSKAMRKVTEEDALYMAMEVTEVGVATIFSMADTRMLFKLP